MSYANFKPGMYLHLICQLPRCNVINNVINNSARPTSQGNWSAARQQPSGNSSITTTQQSAVRRTVDMREFDPALDVNVCNDWAMMASTPNRFAVLSTDDDERNDNDVLNEQAFTTVVHRRNKRNRTSPEAATSA